MTDPSFTPESDRELLVVYPTVERASRARTALLDAGVPPADIQVGDEPDRVVALRAEMHEELTRAWVVPNAAVAYTKEGARGLTLVTLIGAAIALALAFPLALLDLGASYWVRWAVLAAVGVAFASAIGLVVGPATAAERPGDLAAANRGTVVRVAHDTPELRDLLVELDPIRVDEVAHDDTPLDTVATEGTESTAETAKDIAANTGGDDYHPER